LKIRARARTLIYIEPPAIDFAEPEFVFRARIENKTAPMTTSHIAPTAVRTKKVILKMKSWFPETEREP